MAYLDPATGMLTNKKPAYTQGQVDASLRANPQAGLSYLNPGVFADVNALTPGVQGGTTMPSTSGGGNSPFDVKGLLESLLNPIRADALAQGQVDLAGRNSGINRALVQFGALPDFNQAQQALGLNLGEIVSPDTQQLAASNPYSATAQLDKQNTTALRQIKQALAARGALRSGELPYQLQRQQDQYGQAKYEASQKLLDFISGLQQGYLESERQRQSGLNQSAQGFLSQILGMFPNGLPGGGASGAGSSSPSPQSAGAAPAATTAGARMPMPATSQAFDNYGSQDALRRYLDAQLNRRSL